MTFRLKLIIFDESHNVIIIGIIFMEHFILNAKAASLLWTKLLISASAMAKLRTLTNNSQFINKQTIVLSIHMKLENRNFRKLRN